MYRLRNMSEHHRPFAHAVGSAATADRRLRHAEILCRELLRRFFVGSTRPRAARAVTDLEVAGVAVMELQLPLEWQSRLASAPRVMIV